MKKALILGAGNAQRDIIKYCKDQGMFVYVCSYTSGDPAQDDADEFALINISDIDAVAEFAKAKGVDLVYSAGSDIAMPTACKVSEMLGLPHYVSYDTAYICNTKTQLRERLGQDFVGNIQYIETSSIDDQLKGMSFPAIMKPIDSQGQRGVFKIDSREDYVSHFEASVSFSRAKKLIVEEYIDGDEISVNTFSKDGKVVFSLISDRKVWEDLPGGIIHEHIIPGNYSVDPECAEKITDLATRVLAKLEINDGPAYFQIKMKNGKEPKLLEVTPRLDGCHMWRLIKFATGVDLMQMTVDALLGKEIAVDSDYTTKAYNLEFLCEKPGESYNRDKYDTAAAEYLTWYYNTGDTVRKMNGFMEKGGYQIVKKG